LSRLLAIGIMQTAEGEIREIEFSRNPALDRDAYMEIIIGKTARLIETACRCGAALAGATQEQEDAAGAFGLNLGIAFQLVDDALDYVSPTFVTGKPEGGDLREGKITLPLILLMEDSDEAAGENLIERIREKSMTPEMVQTVVERIRSQGYAEKTREEAMAYVAKAEESLSAFPDSGEVAVLRQMASYVLTRSK
jgi:octaprenyl-diphosphate synthase